MTTFPFIRILTLSLVHFAQGVTSVYIAYASAELTQVRSLRKCGAYASAELTQVRSLRKCGAYASAEAGIFP